MGGSSRLKLTLFKGDGSSVPADDGPSQLETAKRKEKKSNDNAADGRRSDDDCESAEAEVLLLLKEARLIPALAFEFISLNTLWRMLQSPDNYSGLILTSPRCVESLEKCIEFQKEEDESFSAWEAHLKDQWSQKLIFCVGPTTASKFENFIGLNNTCHKILISKEGNAESLGQSILQENGKEALTLPLLYPCGSLKRDTLGTVLGESGIPFECLTVYKTIQNPELMNLIVELNESEEDATEKDQNPVYVFYSPSGVQFAVPLLKNLSTKYIIAIGPTTKAALEKFSTISKSKLYQCSSPTNDALLEVLQQINNTILLNKSS